MIYRYAPGEPPADEPHVFSSQAELYEWIERKRRALGLIPDAAPQDDSDGIQDS